MKLWWGGRETKRFEFFALNTQVLISDRKGSCLISLTPVLRLMWGPPSPALPECGRQAETISLFGHKMGGDVKPGDKQVERPPPLA